MISRLSRPNDVCLAVSGRCAAGTALFCGQTAARGCGGDRRLARKFARCIHRKKDLLKSNASIVFLVLHAGSSFAKPLHFSIAGLFAPIKGAKSVKSSIKSLLMGAAMSVAVASAPADGSRISGAGATFPYPIYAKWADSYKKETGNGLNYQSIGSGGGIKQITARTVTFGASDKPLTAKERAAGGDLMQWPMVMGGIVPVVNLEGIKANELTLDGTTLAKIFLGEIKTWDDAAIKALNPSVKLPSDRDCGRSPLRRIGHDLQLHGLPRRRSAPIGNRRLVRRLRWNGRRHWREGQRGRCQQRSAGQEFDRLCRNRLCQAEQAHHHQDGEQGRQDRRSQWRNGSGCRCQRGLGALATASISSSPIRPVRTPGRSRLRPSS